MVSKPVLFMILIIGALWQGCASYRTTAIPPEPRPLGQEIVDAYSAMATPEQAEKLMLPDSGKVLTLRLALQLALLKNPELSAFSYEVRVREALTLQASLLPNPEASFEMENFAGSNGLRGFNGTETTLQLGQLIELAGKRQKRTQVAALESDLATWDYEARRLNVYVAVVNAFVEVITAQRRVALEEELVQLAWDFLKNIQKRVKAGKDSPAEAARAEVELSNAKIALQRAQKELLSSRQRLAATWGDSSLRFQQVSGELDTLVKLPELNKLQSLVKQNPDVARWVAEMQLRDAILASARAQRIPDPTIAGGVRRLNEANASAFVFGVSLPIPLFNRNQGEIRAAEYRKLQAQKLQEATLIAALTRISEIHSRISAVQEEINIIREQSIPRAQEAFQVIREGYLSGRFGFLDVLDAQRTLFDVRSRYLDALVEFHQSVAALERLIGQKIDSIQ